MRSKKRPGEADGIPAGREEDAEGAAAGALETVERQPHRAGAVERVEAAEPEPVEAEDARLVQARLLAQSGELLAAIELARTVVRERPDEVGPRLALGGYYERRSEHLLALEQFEAARELAADNVDVLLGMAAAQTELKRYEPAEGSLKRAQRLEPARADVHACMGTLSYKRGLYAQAELELKRALDLDPDHGVAYFYRGECLNQLGRVDEALEMLERSVVLQPHNPRAYFTMGILYDRKHLPQQAAAMYRKAREVTAA